jgi:hypothetical protein
MENCAITLCHDEMCQYDSVNTQLIEEKNIRHQKCPCRRCHYGGSGTRATTYLFKFLEDLWLYYCKDKIYFCIIKNNFQ